MLVARQEHASQISCQALVKASNNGATLSPMSALPGPRTLPEFRAAFPDEGACIEYLYMTRWGDGFVCPKCDDTHATIIKTRALGSAATATRPP